MTAVRNIVEDLVEKKLWPLALLLVVALVAIPVLATRGGSDEAASPAPGAATPSGAAAQVPVVLEGDAAVDKRTRKGKVRDPFVQLAKAGKAAAASAAGSTASTASGSTGSAGSGAPATTGAQGGPSTAGGKSFLDRVNADRENYARSQQKGSKGTPAAPSAPATQDAPASSGTTPAAPSKRVSAVLRFGDRGEELSRIEDPLVLRALPNSGLPLLVLAGRRSDGKALRFMVNPLARVTGDGRCRPSRERCRTLELREGGSVQVTVASSPTQVERFRLDVARIGEQG